MNTAAKAELLFEAMQAIRARLEGNFDHPALIKIGPLNVKSEDDVYHICRTVLAKLPNRI